MKQTRLTRKYVLKQAQRAISQCLVWTGQTWLETQADWNNFLSHHTLSDCLRLLMRKYSISWFLWLIRTKYNCKMYISYHTTNVNFKIRPTLVYGTQIFTALNSIDSVRVQKAIHRPQTCFRSGHFSTQLCTNVLLSHHMLYVVCDYGINRNRVWKGTGKMWQHKTL